MQSLSPTLRTVCVASMFRHRPVRMALTRFHPRRAQRIGMFANQGNGTCKSARFSSRWFFTRPLVGRELAMLIRRARRQAIGFRLCAVLGVVCERRLERTGWLTCFKSGAVRRSRKTERKRSAMRKLLSSAVLASTLMLGIAGAFYGLLWMQGKEGGTPLAGFILFAGAPLLARSSRHLVGAITPGWPTWLFR